MPFLIFILLTGFAFAQERELRTSLERMAELEEAIKSLNDPECPPEENTAFTGVTSGITVACASGESREGYEEMKVVDCTGDGKIYPGGYRIRAQAGVHPLVPAQSLYRDGGPPARKVEFWSRNGALNETYIYMYDEAGGPDSHNTKSMMFVLPRKVVPSVKVNGNDVEVTMNTGEKIIFDKRTSAIKSGAMREGPLDLTTDRHRRQPPNVQYSGTGISIRLNHRYLDPVLSGEIAEVKQGNKTCRVPRAVLLDSAGKLKSQNDAQFVRAINQSCPDQGFRI